MTMKPFEIQSTSLSIGGVTIDTSAQGKLVIPGVTRAGTSVAIEVQDTGDQSVTWTGNPVVIDGYTYAVYLTGEANGQVGWSMSTYSVDQLDEDGYIDGISVVDGGAGYTGEAVTFSEVMYAAPEGTAIENTTINLWVQIPFMVRCGAGEIQSEFSGGSANTGNFTFDGNRISAIETGEDAVIENDLGVVSLSQDYAQLQWSDDGQLNTGDVGATASYVWTEVDGAFVQTWAGPASQSGAHSHTWQFKHDGTISFPDGTIQTTAYTGQQSGGTPAIPLPSWLTVIAGTHHLPTLNTDYGWDSNGVWTVNSTIGSYPEEGTSYPIRLTTPIAGNLTTVVTVDFVVNDFGADFGIGVWGTGTNPEWQWDIPQGNPGANRIGAQYNGSNPELHGISGGAASESWGLPQPGTYRARLTINPVDPNTANITLETLDTSDNILNTITYLEESFPNLDTYNIGFASDQDNGVDKTYFKNLTINIDNGSTIYTDALTSYDSTAISATANSLVNNGYVLKLEDNGVVTFPDGTKQSTAFIGPPTLDLSQNSQESSGTSSIISGFTAGSSTIIIVASGVEVNSGVESSIVTVSGLGLNWTKRISYTDPTSPTKQRSEIWYAINNTNASVTGDITITYDNEFDDQAVIASCFSNINLDTPFAGTPVTSNYLNNNRYAEATVTIGQTNTIALAFFATPVSSNPGIPAGWQSIGTELNGGSEFWEYISLAYKVYTNAKVEKVTSANQISLGNDNSSGMAIIIDQLVGVSSITTLSFDDNGALPFPDGTKQTTAYTVTETSWVRVLGDGYNSYPFADDYNSNDLWLDTTCAGPNGTIFAAGGYGYGYNPVVYQFDKSGNVLWKWMDWDGRSMDSVSAITYDAGSNRLFVAVPAASDGNQWGTAIYSFLPNSNPIGSWYIDYVNMLADGGDQGQLTVNSIIAKNGNYTVAGEKYGNFTVTNTGLTAGTGTTASKVVFPKANINPYNGLYPSQNNWNFKATNESGVQWQGGLNNLVGRYVVSSGDFTVTGTGTAYWFAIDVDYNNQVYVIRDWYAGSDWLDGAFVTIPGSKLGGVDGGTHTEATYATTNTEDAQPGTRIVAWFNQGTYPNLFNQVNTGSWVVRYYTGPGITKVANVVSIIDNGDGNWKVLIDSTTPSVNATWYFYTAGGNDLTFTVSVWGGGPNSISWTNGPWGLPDTTNIVIDFQSYGGDLTDPTYTFELSYSTQSDAFIYSNADEFNFIMKRDGYGRYNHVTYDATNNVYWAAGYSNSNNDNAVISRFARIDNNWALDYSVTGVGEVTGMALNEDGSKLFVTGWNTNSIMCLNIIDGFTVVGWESSVTDFYYDDFTNIAYYDGYLYSAVPVYGAFINNTTVLIEKINPATGLAVWSRLVESNRDNWQINYEYMGQPLTVNETGVYYVGGNYFKTDDYENGVLVKLPLDGGESYDYTNNRPLDIVSEFKISGKYDGSDLTNWRQTVTDNSISVRSDFNADSSGDFNGYGIGYNYVTPTFNTSIEVLTTGFEHDPLYVPQKNVGFGDYNSYTLQLSDAGKFIRTTDDYTNSTYINVPSDDEVNFPIGTVITLINMNYWDNNSTYMYIQSFNSGSSGYNARVWAAGTSGFPQNNGWSQQWGLKGRGTATLMKIGTNEWLLTGDVTDTNY